MCGWAESMRIPGWTSPRTFLVSPSVLPSATCPPAPPSFKAQWQPSGDRPHARVQLIPMGQDRHLSGLGLPLKLPALPHNRLASPQASQEVPAPTLSCGM